MDVRVPHDGDPERFAQLKAAEMARARELPRAGQRRRRCLRAGASDAAREARRPKCDRHSGQNHISGRGRQFSTDNLTAGAIRA